jgi:uncharacterized Rmd1/YagE family protein
MTATSSVGTANTTATHFSTQAEMMKQLGISTNGQVRPSTRVRDRVNIPRRERRLSRADKRSVESSRVAAHTLYPLKALHIAQTIDLDLVRQHVLCDNTEKRKLFGKNSLVVELYNEDDDTPPQFVAVFRFGSVVFLNVPDKEAADLQARIRKLAKDTITQGAERRESFGILVSKPPSPRRSMEGNHTFNTASTYDNRDRTPPPEQIVTGDYCVVPEIDLNGVAVISNILAQTVALDSYNDMVDKLLSQFADINSSVRATGAFKKTDKSFLFKTVAQNNAIVIDMLSKIRLKDRSDTAWTMTKYETVHYGLKSEFEIDDWFDQIEFKLNLIQQNAKFFLEVLQHQKSNSLEWIIVWLIGLESILMCIDMSGKGEALFKYLGVIS